MKKSFFVGLALLLWTLPGSARADIGASVSAGVGISDVNHTDVTKPRVAFELAPFFQKWIFRLEIPVELQAAPTRYFAVRPGIKIFLPLDFYGRVGYGLGNIGGEGSVTHSLILGVGKEFSLLDSLGILVEGSGEPQLAPNSGAPTNLMLRAGIFIKI
jgi:hypothetical protein